MDRKSPWVLVANLNFLKKEKPLVTICSLRRMIKVFVKIAKIRSKNLTIQHKLLAMDLEIKRKGRKKVVDIG